MSKIQNVADTRLRRLFNALHESRDGHPVWDFIDEEELFECCEYLVAELYGKDFVTEHGYDDTVQ